VTVSVETWSSARSQERAPDVFTVYDAVFDDVEDEQVWRAGTYDVHTSRDGFRLTAAHDDGALVGFAYGYVGERGQWWSDQVVEALPVTVTDVRVGGHFEFVELGVLPGYRRQGIGGRLHDDLMREIGHRQALLSTDDDSQTSARRLYGSRDWVKLGSLTPDSAVLGRWLGSPP
jgi:ribosomal protein S18 acetylase RimI-like enzyme